MTETGSIETAHPYENDTNKCWILFVPKGQVMTQEQCMTLLK